LEAMRFKVSLSLLIVAAGALSLPFIINDAEASQPQASGFLIDFGGWDVTWTEMDMRDNSDPYDALAVACTTNGFTYTVEGGTVEEIDGVPSDGMRTWDLWTISPYSITWVKEQGPAGVDLSGFTIAAWAYTGAGEAPTVAVDESGRSIYGYPQAQRVITLSPAMTEVIGSIRAVDTLVGTDMYSIYPDSVVAGQASGRIKIVGDYLNPSFEQIAAQRPDIVLCDGSLYTHHLMTERLRGVGINAVLMYGGEDIQEIMCNIYIAGLAIEYDMRAHEVISSIEDATDAITGILSSVPQTRGAGVMLALAPDKSPWVSGSYTYVNDLTATVDGVNVFSSMSGWVQINSEQIMSANPAFIILLTVDYMYTAQEYGSMIGSLPAEWRTTDAYKNGDIYMVGGAAGYMSTIPGPRFIQLMEITARILHQDVFTDIDIPKYIGDDYPDYLTFTKDLDFRL